VDRFAADVWALVANYDRDPEWRAGVTTMAPIPSGPATPTTITSEVMRIGGRSYRNGGEVTNLDPGARFTWRTTPGADADADGSRSVEPLGPGRCRVRLEVRVAPGARPAATRPAPADDAAPRPGRRPAPPPHTGRTDPNPQPGSRGA
jgi:uncharacterized membrane protein